MEILRIEDERNPNFGPFNPMPNPGDALAALLIRNYKPEPDPAMRASIVAEVLGTKAPVEMPSPVNDGIEFDRFGLGDHQYHAGFQNLKQYHEWFTRKLVRKALLLNTHMVLRRYSVPDEDVKVGGHQVMFKTDHAKLEYTYPFEEAIK